MFIMLLLIFCPSASAASQTEISTAEDLQLMRSNPDGDFVLTADIDLTGVEWEPFAFSGSLDGAGHTIYNIDISALGSDVETTVDGNAKTYDTVFGGFFSVLNGASVQNLTLRGISIDISTPEDCYVGTLSGYASPETVLDHIQIYDARVNLTETCQREPVDEHDRCIAGIGGIIGFGGGSYTECTAETTLVFSDESAEALRCEEFLGGILACGNASVTDCSVTIDGYAACRGYAHNGGVVGMFYQYDADTALGEVSGCSVSGTITFFEDNTDRRAYCEAYVGELLTWTNIIHCSSDFVRNETFDYTASVSPEKCDEPSYTDTVIAPSCDTWGYTEHVCEGCGYTYHDEIAPPQHTAGEWKVLREATESEDGEEALYCALCGAEMERRSIPKHVTGEWMTVTAPTYDREGLRQRYCSECGILLEEESIPMLIPADSITGLPESLEMRYKDSQTLTAVLSPEDVSDTGVKWSSSDESVVSVEESTGEVHALARGSATLTCTSADGFVSQTVPVTVTLTTGQWLIKILLFGWIWY